MCNPPAPMVSATITPGGATSFCNGDSVVLSADTGVNHTYQWLVSGAPINGATGANYVARDSRVQFLLGYLLTAPG